MRKNADNLLYVCIDIIRQHVLPGVVCSRSVTTSRPVTVQNVAGRHITLTMQQPPPPLTELSRLSPAAASLLSAGSEDDVELMVEGARTAQSDIMATNGVLHVIDAVLFYSSGQFTAICLSHAGATFWHTGSSRIAFRF